MACGVQRLQARHRARRKPAHGTGSAPSPSSSSPPRPSFQPLLCPLPPHLPPSLHLRLLPRPSSPPPFPLPLSGSTIYIPTPPPLCPPLPLLFQPSIAVALRHRRQCPPIPPSFPFHLPPAYSSSSSPSSPSSTVITLLSGEAIALASIASAALPCSLSFSFVRSTVCLPSLRLSPSISASISSAEHRWPPPSPSSPLFFATGVSPPPPPHIGRLPLLPLLSSSPSASPHRLHHRSAASIAVATSPTTAASISLPSSVNHRAPLTLFPLRRRDPDDNLPLLSLSSLLPLRPPSSAAAIIDLPAGHGNFSP